MLGSAHAWHRTSMSEPSADDQPACGRGHRSGQYQHQWVQHVPSPRLDRGHARRAQGSTTRPHDHTATVFPCQLSLGSTAPRGSERRWPNAWAWAANLQLGRLLAPLAVNHNTCWSAAPGGHAAITEEGGKNVNADADGEVFGKHGHDSGSGGSRDYWSVLVGRRYVLHMYVHGGLCACTCVAIRASYCAAALRR